MFTGNAARKNQADTINHNYYLYKITDQNDLSEQVFKQRTLKCRQSKNKGFLYDLCLDKAQQSEALLFILIQSGPSDGPKIL